MAEGNLYCKSCEHMDELKDNSVDLIVTSPPYWNARDYGMYVTNRKRNYLRRMRWSYKEYLALMERCFRDCYRVLKEGRFCAVNVSHILYKGKHYPIPFDLYFILKRIGFELHQEIIWNKALVGFKRISSSTMFLTPTRFYPNFMFEYILVFTKPGNKITADRTNRETTDSVVIVDSFFRKEIANNVWHIVTVKPKTLDHPAAFPEEIPYRLILLYSYKGDLVLDPFVGSGTTAAVAHALGRKFCGYDTQEEFIDAAKKRIGQPVYLKGLIVPEFRRRNKVLVRKR